MSFLQISYLSGREFPIKCKFIFDPQILMEDRGWFAQVGSEYFVVHIERLNKGRNFFFSSGYYSGEHWKILFKYVGDGELSGN